MHAALDFLASRRTHQGTEAAMPYLSPPTLTEGEQRTILAVTAANPRDHAIVSMALGTGLRLGELLGLDVGDVFDCNGTPRQRVRVRTEMAGVGLSDSGLMPAAVGGPTPHTSNTAQQPGPGRVVILGKALPERSDSGLSRGQNQSQWLGEAATPPLREPC
jgi:hypothetical protein